MGKMLEIRSGKTSGKTEAMLQLIAEYKRLNPNAIIHVVKPQDDWVDQSAVGIVFPEYGLMKRFNAFP